MIKPILFRLYSKRFKLILLIDYVGLIRFYPGLSRDFKYMWFTSTLDICLSIQILTNQCGMHKKRYKKIAKLIKDFSRCAWVWFFHIFQLMSNI